jgi:MOSC domain-containing protein YiiM
MIDSASMGNPARHRPFVELEEGLRALAPAPAGRGSVTLIIRRGPSGVRETPPRVVLRVGAGVPGDAWGRDPHRVEVAQLAVMQRDVADLIANGQPLVLSGDNLILDLDLSSENLPVASRLRAGGALLEVTPKPHNGCAKFKARFGDGALRFVSMPALRHRNLRGIYLRVVEEGEVAVGDAVELIARGPTATKFLST